jgi:DNA-directed RNA polymerase I, II, and III subunit RPABC2
MSYFDGGENGDSENENENENDSNASDDEEVEVEDVEADVDADVDLDVDLDADVDDPDVDDVDGEDIDEVEEDVGEGEGEGDELEEKEGEEQDEDEQDDDEENNRGKKIKTVPTKNVYKNPVEFFNEDDDEDDEDDDGEQYLQKFDQSINDNYILNFHPESVLQNYNEILSMTNVVRNSDGIIIDDLHKTIPYLTKYEKARILGQRAKQINSGHHTFVKVPENVIDGYIIAEMELKLKRIPFIIRRPLPNGGSEYWKIQDLENISF